MTTIKLYMQSMSCDSGRMFAELSSHITFQRIIYKRYIYINTVYISITNSFSSKECKIS